MEKEQITVSTCIPYTQEYWMKRIKRGGGNASAGEGGRERPNVLEGTPNTRWVIIGSAESPRNITGYFDAENVITTLVSTHYRLLLSPKRKVGETVIFFYSYCSNSVP
ncbi:hypothetical protein CEXT_780711 [Caerostris extrusa]|uniref:LAGLIDADG homing endonuclease n=1 Tax=Caerostris extrusa TaxID=172846 RepID=A0AAV4TS24_CAEEX|nr:hypothetical protein CEXT_780711 [Caerostris extrusa]